MIEDDDDGEGWPETEGRKRPPKNPKRSARSRFNRRKRLVSHALGELEDAARRLLSQPGRAPYGKEELNAILDAISTFREAVDLGPADDDRPLSEEAWESISKTLGILPEDADGEHDPE